ncbi:MAG: hypothetical protein ACPW60_04410 [Methylohalobius sp. ZOD2]
MKELMRHPGTWLLIAGCLLAALGVGIEYRLLQRQTAEALQPSPAPSKEAQIPEAIPENAAELPPIDTFTALIVNPLFIEGRQPLPEESQTSNAETEEAEAEKKPPPDLRLTGILNTPEAGQIILVQDPEGKTLRFKPGDIIDGWQVTEPETDQVVLDQDGEHHILKLIKPRPGQAKAEKNQKRPSPHDNPFARAARRKNNQ